MLHVPLSNRPLNWRHSTQKTAFHSKTRGYCRHALQSLSQHRVGTVVRCSCVYISTRLSVPDADHENRKHTGCAPEVQACLSGALATYRLNSDQIDEQKLLAGRMSPDAKRCHTSGVSYIADANWNTCPGLQLIARASGDG